MKSLAVALVVAAIGVTHTGALHRIGASSASPFGSFDRTAMLKYIGEKLKQRPTDCSADEIHILNPVNASVPGVGHEDEEASKVEKARGYDFRGCYGETVDLLGHPVCGSHVLNILHTQLKDLKLEEEAMITDIPGFVIKSVSESESENMKSFLPQYGKMTGRRVYPACHRTGIAPICGLLEIHLNEEATHRWILMRAVEIPAFKGEAPTRVSQHYEKEGYTFMGRELGGGKAEVNEYDLKGPAFAQVPDSMKRATSPDKLAKIDAGFHSIFPEGIQLDGCGSRAAVAVLGQDTMILRDEGFTDYSLFVKSYDATEEFPSREDRPKMTLTHQSHNKDCVCGSKPVFPLILDGVTTKGDEDIKVRFAVGIIGYLETGEANAAMESNPRAAMIAPIPYRGAWMKMFPKYFMLPPIKMADWEADFGTKPEKGILVCALASFQIGECDIQAGNEVTFEGSAYERAGEEETQNNNMILVDYGKDQSCKVPARVLAPEAVCTYDKARDDLKRKLKAVLPEEDGVLKDNSLQKRVQHVISKLVTALKTNFAPMSPADPTMPGAKPAVPLMITFPGFSPMMKGINRIVRRLLT